MKSLVTLIILTVLAGCSSEYLPFSSGELQGTEASILDHWQAVAEADIIQLETDAGEKYSVNLWIIGMQGNFYVHAGDNRAAWVEDIEVNPDLRIGHDGNVFLFTAVRVTDQSEFDAFGEEWNNKYGRYPGNPSVTEAYLYRLTGRQGE